MGACVSINRPRFKTIKGRESAFHDITTRERSRSRQLNKRRLQRTAFQHKTSSRHPWHVQHSDTEISSTSNCLAEDISNNSRRHCVMEPLIRMAAPPITIMQQQLPGQCDTTDDSADSNYNREAIATASPATRGIIVVAECPATEVTSHQQTDVDSSSDEDLLGYDQSHVIVVKPAEAAVVHPTCSGTVHTQCSTVNRSEPIPSPVECESLATILSSGYDSCVEPPTPERKKNNIIEEKNRRDLPPLVPNAAHISVDEPLIVMNKPPTVSPNYHRKRNMVEPKVQDFSWCYGNKELSNTPPPTTNESRSNIGFTKIRMNYHDKRRFKIQKAKK